VTTSSNHENLANYEEIRVKESNADVRIFITSSKIAVSAHAWWKCS